MRNLNIVQFVCFETTLASDQFIRRWEEYNRSESSDMNVTLQQREGEKKALHGRKFSGDRIPVFRCSRSQAPLGNARREALLHDKFLTIDALSPSITV